jgi:hypothetical protein
MSGMPRCWGTKRSWIEWNRFNEQTSAAPGKPLDHYCVDCEPAYQARMCEQQRCAYPDVSFISVSERRRDPATGKMQLVDTGMVRGRRSDADEAAWQRRHEIRKEEADESQTANEE